MSHLALVLIESLFFVMVAPLALAVAIVAIVERLCCPSHSD